MAELRKGGFKSVGEALGSYLNPENSEAGTFQRFAGNLVSNVRELTGTDDESINRHHAGFKAAMALQRHQLGTETLTPEQLAQLEPLAKDWSINIASNVGAVAPISKAVRAENLAKFMEGSKVQNPVYHGGESTVLDFSKGPSRGSGIGSGYFSTDKEVAKAYAETGQPPLSEMARKFRNGEITEANISIKKPIDESTTFKEFFNGDKNKAFSMVDETVSDYDKSDLLDALEDDGDEFWELIENADLENLNTDKELFVPFMKSSNLLRSIGNYHDSDYVKRLLKERDYDGIIHNDFENGAETVIPFSPNQIKSANGNRGTFDPNDPNILHGLSVGSAMGSKNKEEKKSGTTVDNYLNQYYKHGN